MPGEALVVVDGVTYRGDGQTRTVSPLDDVSQFVLLAMDTGEPVGPGVDEWVGMTAEWSRYPQSMIAAFMTIADQTGRTVTWYSDRGNPPPDSSQGPAS